MKGFFQSPENKIFYQIWNTLFFPFYLRHAIADFLKLELQPDGYTLKMASEAKDIAQRGKVQIEKSNETNLFREKEEDLIELGSLKTLASSLLQLQ